MQCVFSHRTVRPYRRWTLLSQNVKVIGDVRRSLFGEMNGHVDLGDSAGHITIPEGTSLSMVTKAFLKEYLEDVGFGAYRALVAVGSVDTSGGIVTPEFCFATLYYGKDAKLVSIDFHTGWR